MQWLYCIFGQLEMHQKSNRQNTEKSITANFCSEKVVFRIILAEILHFDNIIV